MELELKKLYDTVASIHDEMFYLRERYGMSAFCFLSLWYDFIVCVWLW